MKTIALLLLFVSTALMAYEEFSIEERFAKPVKIPAPISLHLNKELAKDITYCQDEKHSDMFEAQTVSLNKSTKVYLVKPAAICLCGVYYCPMWMFQVKGKKTSLIWNTPGTGVAAILNTKSNGYRQIKEFGGSGGHGYQSIWSWDGKKYQQVYRQTYRTSSKGCADTETFRLKAGKLVSVSNECLVDIPEP